MNDIRHSSYNHDNPTSSKLTSKQLQPPPQKKTTTYFSTCSKKNTHE